MKGLDRTWTSEILSEVFDMYGEVKSAKVSINPITGKSNGYGFVLFKSEISAFKMIEASQSGEIPFIAELYRPRSTVINPECKPDSEETELVKSFMALLGILAEEQTDFSKDSKEFKP